MIKSDPHARVEAFIPEGLEDRLRHTPLHSVYNVVRTAPAMLYYWPQFRNLQTYCMFVGYPRSGHSLVGSLLTGHPDMAISHELDALAHLGQVYHRYQLYSLILQRDHTFTESGRNWNYYSYHVPELQQGEYRDLRVIGDKKGGTSTRQLTAHPDLLGGLRRLIREDLRVIHVVRHPFDNIGSMCRTGRADTVEEGIDIYFKHAEGVKGIKRRLSGDELFELTHEEFVESPARRLSALCDYLGVDAPAGYLDACSAFVFDSPSRSREHADWSPQAKEAVEERAAAFDWLSGYRFD